VIAIALRNETFAGDGKLFLQQASVAAFTTFSAFSMITATD
jgi:fluoride ion exporter CrcB/FEX